MEEIINGLKQIKTRVDSGTITTVNGTETLLSKQIAKMIKEAINYTRCSTELKCGECDCEIKYPNIGCDTVKDCKKTH